MINGAGAPDLKHQPNTPYTLTSKSRVQRPFVGFDVCLQSFCVIMWALYRCYHHGLISKDVADFKRKTFLVRALMSKLVAVCVLSQKLEPLQA